MTNVYELFPRFAALFDGLKEAHGTGAGRWVKRPINAQDWVAHLSGRGVGLGVAPLRPDNTVKFAAIDLDEPDFDAAREMQRFLPGTSFIERSRSGNAHIWAFFREPIEAWLAMGVMREATFAAGKNHVEIFPKAHDFERVRFGNYINLPYHGWKRPIILSNDVELTLEQFLDRAGYGLNDPQHWEERAEWLQLSNPSNVRRSKVEWGTQDHLHMCAEYILSGEAGVITEGGRNQVLLSLAKMLMNCTMYDNDEVHEMLMAFNEDLVVPPEDPHEIERIMRNVEQARYTSTGCDDPLVAPYSHPDCPIAHASRR